MALASVVIVSAQVLVHVVLYWARVQTFIISPGRFAIWQPVLGLDVVVFGLPLFASVALVALLLRSLRVQARVALLTAVILATRKHQRQSKQRSGGCAHASDAQRAQHVLAALGRESTD